MTPEQEQIAERVIQLHKDNNGIYDWKNFTDVFNTTHNDRLVIARALRDKDIIGDHTTGTRLKEPGWTFKGFEAERQKDLLERKRQERKDKADELDLHLKQWQVKTKYLPYIVSVLALTVSIISYFKPEKRQPDLRQVQDSLFREDTLFKKHN